MLPRVTASLRLQGGRRRLGSWVWVRVLGALLLAWRSGYFGNDSRLRGRRFLLRRTMLPGSRRARQRSGGRIRRGFLKGSLMSSVFFLQDPIQGLRELRRIVDLAAARTGWKLEVVGNRPFHVSFHKPCSTIAPSKMNVRSAHDAGKRFKILRIHASPFRMIVPFCRTRSSFGK